MGIDPVLTLRIFVQAGRKTTIIIGHNNGHTRIKCKVQGNNKSDYTPQVWMSENIRGCFLVGMIPALGFEN